MQRLVENFKVQEENVGPPHLSLDNLLVHDFIILTGIVERTSVRSIHFCTCSLLLIAD